MSAIASVEASEVTDPSVRAMAYRKALADPTRGAGDLAIEIMTEVGLPDRLHAVFYSLVRHECTSRLRAANRMAEPTKPRPKTERLPGAAKNVGAVSRPTWMRQRFAISDGRMVTWAEATKADHQARIDMQLKLALGIKRDVDQHKDAIQRIAACPGATCLGDLPEYGGTAGKAAS